MIIRHDLHTGLVSRHSAVESGMTCTGLVSTFPCFSTFESEIIIIKNRMTIYLVKWKKKTVRAVVMHRKVFPLYRIDFHSGTRSYPGYSVNKTFHMVECENYIPLVCGK